MRKRSTIKDALRRLTCPVGVLQEKLAMELRLSGDVLTFEGAHWPRAGLIDRMLEILRRHRRLQKAAMDQSHIPHEEKVEANEEDSFGGNGDDVEPQEDDPRGPAHNDAAEDEDVRDYGPDFKVSNRGVFARLLDCDGTPHWEQISSTRIDVLGLTRDARGENWGTSVSVRNRDGNTTTVAIPHTLTAADKSCEIAAMLASLGVALLPGKTARQLLLQFLTIDVNERITAVSQIGWHQSGEAWIFVLPDETIVPAGFAGAPAVLQTPSLHVQHGLHVSGTVEQWIAEIAAPLAGNSNVQLCVGVAFAGPLLKWANEQPGLFHLWGASKNAKSLAGAVGQSVWGCPKMPGEVDAFGASWTATAVGLEAYAVLRSDVGGYFDEMGEGTPKAIRQAVYALANGSTKLRGNAKGTLRPTESFRILAISTGEPTMEAFLSSPREKVPTGLSVRLVDVPAEVQSGSAFETCSNADIETYGKRFYPLTAQLHGAVGRAWLRYLVDVGHDEIQGCVSRHRDEWLALPLVASVRTQGTSQVRSVLNRFALVAAALRMAIEAELLPWQVNDVDRGVAACMARWAAARKGRLDLPGELASAIEQVRIILSANLHGRFIHQHIAEGGRLAYVTPADATKRDTLGYVKDGRILIEPTAWRQVVCAGYDPEKTARHLKNEGLLLADVAGGKLQRQEKVVRGDAIRKARFYVLDMRILNDAVGSEPSHDVG